MYTDKYEVSVNEDCYPEPRKRRKIWQSLDGEWEFAFGDGTDYPMKIRVPYAYQCEASGIGNPEQHDVIRYKRTFRLSDELKNCKTVFLNFLAVDYECTVYVNGRFAIFHEGGYGDFGADITPYLTGGEQTIELRVYDPMTRIYPRGKQNWLEGRQRCWYHCTSGIWQSVWLDGANGDYITEVRFDTDVEKTQACAFAETASGVADEITATVKTPHGTEQRFTSTTVRDGRLVLDMAFEKPDCVDDIHLWTIEHPKLYETVLTIRKNGEVLDEIETYFAFRTIRIANGRVYVNSEATELRMVLNQGYLEGYGLSMPIETIKEDILVAKRLGFNGMRIHQKSENPWLYYYADVLGMYLWAETPSAYAFTPISTRALLSLQQDIVKRVYNSPSVIAYVPFNESWGVKEILYSSREQSLAKAAYHLIKSLDDSRLVITNDGWENVGTTDLIGVHDYSKYADEFPEKFAAPVESLVPAGRRLMAYGNEIGNKPLMLTEFGGVALANGNGWGYCGAEKDNNSFIERFGRLLKNISECNFCGWCYTQLTDVEQETNGLLDSRHKPKFDVGKIREVIDLYAKKFY